MARKPCIRCGGEKGPGKSRRHCDRCRAEVANKANCKKCGKPKPPGRGRVVCDACRAPVRKCGEQTPCRDCGGRENKLPRKQVCEDCRELATWKDERRRASRKIRNREPCIDCGGRKSDGRGVRYCNRCKAKRQAQPVCQRCGKKPIRRKYANLCIDCKRKADQRRRERHARYYREARKQPGVRERIRERERERWRQLRQDPVRWAKHLEDSRMRHRLRALNAGRPLRVAQSSGDGRGTSLPGAALAAVVYAAADRERSGGNPWAMPTDSGNDSYLGVVCERIGVSERDVYRWRVGESDPTLASIDSVLTTLGMLWWDVWTEDTVRVPILVVRTYFWRKRPQGMRRERSRTIPYGDQGPDRERLAEIGRIMDGEEALAA